MSAEATIPLETLEFEYEDRFGWIVRGVPRVLGDERPDGGTWKGSRVVVTEDDRPLPAGHEPHEEIQGRGGGRYSHWGNCVRFSTTDNSNPATNGRVYHLVVGTTRIPLRPASAEPEWAAEVERRLHERRASVRDVDDWCRHTEGFAWALDLAEMTRRAYLAQLPQKERLEVREDGRALTTAACADEVKREGGGRFVREGDRVFFASSDGSNPKLNGRHYALAVGDAVVDIPPSPMAAILGGYETPADPGMRALVRRAVETGRDIPLDLPHGRIDYYHFLAGLMRSCGFTRMLEIGTERGYSASASAIGMGDTIECLVTCDLGDRAPILNRHRRVHRVVGDVMARANIQRVLALFDYRPIDVLFVDSGHDYPTTAAHMGTFASFLRPRLVLVDDILLNEDMARFWRDIRLIYGSRAVNACDIDPRVRVCECGFGIVILDERLTATAGS